MKVQVPPAPVSTLPLRSTVAPPSLVRGQREKAAAPLDARFLRRSVVWTLVLGACLALMTLSATRSGGAALSLMLGAGAGAGLLWSEMALIGRVLTAAADARRTKSSGKRMLLGVLWVAKWIPVGAVLMALCKTSWFAALPFALGCTVFQVVVFSKVLGRVLVSR